MKQVLAGSMLAACLLAGMAAAQAPAANVRTGKQMELPPVPPVSSVITQNARPVSHTDLYCSGGITGGQFSREQAVMGGVNSPNATQFHTGDILYLRGNYQPGTRVSLVRETSDPNRLEAFEGQAKLIKKFGRQYADLGYAVIVEQRGDHAVAKVEFACDAIVTGDLVTAFVAKPAIAYRVVSKSDRFPDREPAVSGRILMARDFDQYVGTGHRVYLSLGWDQGVKLGDYVKITRGYQEGEMDLGDAASAQTTGEVDTQVKPAKVTAAEYAKLPRRVVGEAIVVGVGAKTATAVVTFALSEVHVGDRVDVEDETQMQ